MKELEQWICWREEERNGKATKVPVNPDSDDYASTRQRDTWDTYESALTAVKTVGANGVGFVFTQEDPFVGVDLDDCRDPNTGETVAWAQKIIERLNSYTEISPSTTGHHVIVRGTLPDGRRRRGDLEMYEDGRFFTMTGKHLAGTPKRVMDRSEALEAVYTDFIEPNEDIEMANSKPPQTEQVPDKEPNSDQELIKLARDAANGDTFERLWNGDTTGYESQSEADMALCCYLAFWTGGNTKRMDRLFRQSGLMRDKWDTIHYADGSTYGEKTIERAATITKDSYF